ncbi:MAG TPA: hypothetical protein VFE47_32310, partial [Tepidisphaeraceae bacterium]|nr:hypothetical protein [Tepidisphaeraceae bacterium]
LDPLEVAIDSVCNADLMPRTVRSEDLKDFQGLIVASPAADASLASEACRLRALAGSDMPILHITAPRERPSMIEAPAFEEMEYPITLKRLSRFVSTLKSGNHSDVGRQQ